MGSIRITAAMAATALLLAACSSSDRPETRTAGAGPGPTTGLTDDTMTIAYMVPDFGVLAESGLAPDVGDPQQQIAAYVEKVNEEGGIAGRDVVATFHPYDAADFSGVSAREACVAALEDDEAFVVLALPPWPTVGTLCVTEDHATPLVTASQLTPSVMERSGGRAFSLAMDWAREYAAWANLLDERGELDGRTIGIVTGDDDDLRQEAIDEGLVPALEELGHEVAQTAVLPCASPTCEQHETAVQRLETEGVDYVFDALGPVASPAFIAAADAAGYQPRYTFPGGLLSDTVAEFHAAVGPAIDGMLGVGDYGRPAAGDPPEEGQFGRACNETYASFAGVERHPPESDAAGMTNLGCLLTELVKLGAEAADEGDAAGNGFGQAALVRGIESLGTLEFFVPADGVGCPPADRTLSFGPDKHDGTDFVMVVGFDAAGTRFSRLPDCEWVRVP